MLGALQDLQQMGSIPVSSGATAYRDAAHVLQGLQGFWVNWFGLDTYAGLGCQGPSSLGTGREYHCSSSSKSADMCNSTTFNSMPCTPDLTACSSCLSAYDGDRVTPVEQTQQ